MLQTTKEERSFVLNTRGKRLFRALHMPENPTALWILCNPILEEKVVCQATYIAFARYLAAKDIAVARFDYEGSGDSEGDIEARSVDSWVADTLDIIAGCLSVCDTLPVTLLGLRFGGIIAALSANHSAVHRIVL